MSYLKKKQGHILEYVEFLDENDISRDGLATDSVKAYILSLD